MHTRILYLGYLIVSDAFPNHKTGFFTHHNVVNTNAVRLDYQWTASLDDRCFDCIMLSAPHHAAITHIISFLPSK